MILRRFNNALALNKTVNFVESEALLRKLCGEKGYIVCWQNISNKFNDKSLPSRYSVELWPLNYDFLTSCSYMINK